MSNPYTARGATRLSVALLIAIISVIVYSCRKELIKSQNDPSLAISNPDVQAAHDWYVTAYPIATDQVTRQNIESVKQDRMLNWNKTFSPYWNKAQAFISKKGLNIVEAPALKSGDMAFASKVPANLSSFDFSKSQSLTSLIIVKQQGQYGVYAMTVYGDSTYLKGDYSKLKNNTYRTKDKDFTGWVFYHSMNGTFINGWRYINGLVVSAVYQQATAPAQTGPAIQSVKKVNLLMSCDQILMTEVMETCSYYSWDTDMQYAFDCYTWDNPATSYTYTLCFPNYGGGSGSNNTLNYCTVSGTNAVVKKNVNVVQTPPDDGGDPDNSNNGSGSNDSGNNNNPPSDPNGEIDPPIPCPTYAIPTTNADFMAQMDISNLPDCFKTVLKNLQASDNATIADYISIFSGDTPGYKWVLKAGGSDPDNNAVTVGATINQVYTQTTTFYEDNYVNGSDLAVAETIMHEGLHAYLNAYFRANPLEAHTTYSQMMDDYVRAKKPDLNAIQHDEFVRDFLGQLAAQLQAYGESKGYQIDPQYYSDLTWAGLFDTSAFKSLSDTDKNRIKDVLNTEQNATDRNGNPTRKKGTSPGC